MATIHVIYDPNDVVKVPSQKPNGVVMVSMQCNPDAERAELDALVQQLALLLLEHHR